MKSDAYKEAALASGGVSAALIGTPMVATGDFLGGPFILSAIGLIALAAFSAILWYVWRDETGAKETYKKAAMWVAILSLIGAMATTAISTQPLTIAGKESKTVGFTMNIAQQTSCYDFPAFATDGTCAGASTDVMVVDTVDKQVTVKLWVDDTDNAIYYGATGATALDGFGVSMTITRDDDGWTESGSFINGILSASSTKSSDNLPTVQNNNSVDVNLLARSTFGQYQVAWGDTGSGTQVGAMDAGGLGSLAPGGSGTLDLYWYLNEVGLYSSINEQTITWSSTITINMHVEGETGVGDYAETWQLTIIVDFQLT